MVQINQTQIEVVRGAVHEQNVQAIVNAANTMMRGGGGVDGAIHRAAGLKLLEELRRVAPLGSQTSQVVVTGTHNLSQQFIFHVAGPIYRNYSSDEAARLLSAAYANCLAQADLLRVETLAFPSLSTGAYGYPLDAAAPLCLQTLCKYLQAHPNTTLRHIILAMFAREEFDVFSGAVQVLAEELKS